MKRESSEAGSVVHRWRRIGMAGAGLVAIIALALIERSSPTSAKLPFPNQPALACQGASTAFKAGQQVTFEWQPLVEVDRADGSAIVLDSGTFTKLCVVSRAEDGTLGPVMSGIGQSDPMPRASLTLDSGMSFTRSGYDLAYGRVPAGTERIVINGREPAHVANGFWLEWLDAPTELVQIDAYGSDDRLLDRLDDPDGIHFGA